MQGDRATLSVEDSGHGQFRVAISRFDAVTGEKVWSAVPGLTWKEALDLIEGALLAALGQQGTLF